MSRERIVAALTSARALVVFAGANLLGLIPDVWLAHTSFWHSRWEVVPLVVSAASGVLVLALAVTALGRVAKIVADLVAAACIATGVAGLYLHLGGDALAQPSLQRLLQRLVYSAPILAPAAYAGLGLVLMAAVHLADPRRRGRAAMLLAGLGLFGNFALCLLDHAQNGFWAPVEWASVVAGALGGMTVTTAALVGTLAPGERRFVWWVLAALMVVSAVGTSLHLAADLRTGGLLVDRLRYGAPVFAPALFADLALLAGLGLLARAAPSNTVAPR